MAITGSVFSAFKIIVGVATFQRSPKDTVRLQQMVQAVPPALLNKRGSTHAVGDTNFQEIPWNERCLLALKRWGEPCHCFCFSHVCVA